MRLHLLKQHCISLLAAPSHNHKGTRFVTAFLGSGEFTPYLYVIGDVQTIINIQIPSEYIDETSTIAPGTSIRPFSQTLGQHTSRITNKAVEVVSDNPVYFYTSVSKYGSADATFILPVSALGTEYMVIGHNSTQSGDESFVVASTAENTQVTITLPSGDSETVMLNQFETYFREEAMLSGTRVNASAPVAVVAAHKCAHIPTTDQDNCQYIEEAMPPVRAYSKEFVLGYMRPRPQFTIGVVASADATVVNVYTKSGTLSDTIILSRGQVAQRAFYNSNILSLVSNQGILVVQYGHTENENSLDGGPSMMLIPGIQGYGHEYNFQVFTGWFDPAGLTVVIKNGTEADLLIDNTQVSPVSKTAVEVPGLGLYQLLYIQVNSGNHYLTHTKNESFGAWLYARATDSQEYSMCLGLTT